MNYSKGTAPVKVVFFILISTIGMSSASTSNSICDYNTWTNYCSLKNVSILTEAEATKFVFPKETKIRFDKPKILSSAKILFGRLPDVVEEMYIYKGHVPEVYINHTIYEFRASSNRLQKVIIDPTGTYKLRKLIICFNLLQSVPDNIEKLTNLVHLILYDNKIETVSMDHFKDLTNLRSLALQSNSIVRVETTVPINLPNLEVLYLEQNSLQYLSITFWNFPSLQRFDVNDNKLRNIMNFPKRFPKLQELRIRNNQWSCAWLEAIKSEMGKINKDSEKCSGKSVDNICCQDYSTDDNNFNSIEERMAFWLLQMSENLQKSIQQIDGKIFKLATDTRMLIDTKVTDVDRTVQRITDKIESLESNVRKEMLQELKKINAKVDYNRALVVDDLQKFQKEIEKIGASVSKQTTGIQEKVKSMESSSRMELTQINVRIDENRASFTNDRNQFQKGIDTIGESISKITTATRELIDSKISNMTETVKEIKVEQYQAIQKINVRVDENRASIVDDRKQLEEKITNADNQNREQFKLVNQKLNENRALINDVVEDLYLEELEKQEL